MLGLSSRPLLPQSSSTSSSFSSSTPLHASGPLFFAPQASAFRTPRHLRIRREELQMIRCKGHVGRSKGFIQIRSLLGPDDWKDRKRLPEQVAKDDFSQIVTGFRLESLDPFVPIFVLRMMK